MLRNAPVILHLSCFQAGAVKMTAQKSCDIDLIPFRVVGHPAGSAAGNCDPEIFRGTGPGIVDNQM